ncbi:TlpA disulfide reductase family protein [Carboxylicivirga sp. M1479]|uniref:TlpA family protein disulfide reductase n=1 Tax=Carboxylicivirga sp. M1479 TaxID=2594476 RepID=UPI0011775598|nr:TlpA disulfide reductase family protein [Carboxylicivirga sp. M1479]TRX71044.1 TlpA family protein disulfide reductase [Carboxylicivirga sp. M1479]
MRLGFLVVYLFGALLLQAQSLPQWTTVKGLAPEYAGYNLVVRKVVNPISFEETDVMVIRVEENGEFEQSIEISQITHVSIDMGKYEGYIFLEPGQTYELILPPFQPRTDAERFNPYYKPELIELGIANDDAQSLNMLFMQFDSELKRMYNSNAVQIFSSGDIVKAKSIIAQLDSAFQSDIAYFNTYKQYAYGELLTLGYKRNKRKAIEQTFGADTINVALPSFQQSFNTLFNNFFTNYFSSKRGENLKDAYVQIASFDSLTTVLQTDTLYWNKDLAQLVLLKGLYDAFYSGRYEQGQIIDLIEQASEYGASLTIKDVAKGLYRQVIWLREGSAAPQFTLFRLDGREKSLSDYKGKFVYLNFMHTSNHTCKEELMLLNVLSKQLRRELTIVTVIMDEDPTNAKKLIKDNKYRWDFLHYGAMPTVAIDYRIKALPAYFVIDPTQKLRLSPSPSPKENFTPIFIESQRQFNYEQLRKERPKTKSIYDL